MACIVTGAVGIAASMVLLVTSGFTRLVRLLPKIGTKKATTT